VQVRAKLDTSSEEGRVSKDHDGFWCLRSLFNIIWDEIATQRSNSTPRNCTEVCIISLPTCLPGKSLYGGIWETTAKKERPSTWSWPQKRPKVNGSTLGQQAKRWIKAIDTGWFLLPSFFFSCNWGLTFLFLEERFPPLLYPQKSTNMKFSV